MFFCQADHRRAWGDENDKPSSARFDEEPPFQPTNHTGTQINVYHGPPGEFMFTLLSVDSFVY